MNKKVQDVADKLDGKVVLTENEITECSQAVYRTYAAIADDAHIPEGSPVHEILEVVLEADYVRSYGNLPEPLYTKFRTWVSQELAKGGSWKSKFSRIGKVIWK